MTQQQDHELKCEAEVGEGYGYRPKCGKPATQAAPRGYASEELMGVCNLHAGAIRRRKFYKREVYELTPERAAAIQERIDRNKQIDQERISRERAANAARREQERLLDWEHAERTYQTTRNDVEDLDYQSMKTVTIPRWQVQASGQRPRFSDLGVKVVRREGYPTVLEFRSAPALHLNQADALIEALKFALKVAREE